MFKTPIPHSGFPELTIGKPAVLDRYLTALPAISLIPFGPFAEIGPMRAADLFDKLKAGSAATTTTTNPPCIVASFVPHSAGLRRVRSAL